MVNNTLGLGMVVRTCRTWRAVSACEGVERGLKIFATSKYSNAQTRRPGLKLLCLDAVLSPCKFPWPSCSGIVRKQKQTDC